MIYIIGDSHVSVFSGTDKGHDGLRHIQPEFGTCYTLSGGSLRPHNRFEQRIPEFCPIKIGSNTAYNSYSKLPIIEQALKEYNVTNEDEVYLCFGEIDIRNHIGPNAEKANIGMSDGIKLCVDRYAETIYYLKDKGYNIGVYGPPASSVGYPSTYGWKDVFKRNIMTIEFNGYLRMVCNRNDFKFVSIEKEMMLPNGDTDPKFIMDDIHLSQEAMPLLKKAFNING